MVFYYFLLAHNLYLWYTTTIYWSTGLSLWYPTSFYWPTAYPYGTLTFSTGKLPTPMVHYYLLLAHCLYLWYTTTYYWSTELSLWYFTIIYWLPAFPFDLLPSSNGHLPIPRVLFYNLRLPVYYLLLAPFLSL